MKRYINVSCLDVLGLITKNISYSYSADKLIFDLDMDSVKGDTTTETIAKRRLLKEIIGMIGEKAGEV